MFPPGIEPGTFRVLGGCDNHYTTETELRSEAGETARLLQAGILCHKQSLATGQDLDIWSIPHENGLKRGLSGLKQTFPKLCLSGRDRLVVRTLRCGRSNPGSNPGHGSDIFSVIKKKCFFLTQRDFKFITSVSGIVVSIAAFQAVDPGSIPG